MTKNREINIVKSTSSDNTAVWVYGKVSPGWYMASAVWSTAYADHLKSLGYQVERSTKKPEVAA